MRLAGPVFVALIIVCSGGAFSAQGDGTRPVRILFIGNSLTLAQQRLLSRLDPADRRRDHPIDGGD